MHLLNTYIYTNVNIYIYICVNSVKDHVVPKRACITNLFGYVEMCSCNFFSSSPMSLHKSDWLSIPGQALWTRDVLRSDAVKAHREQIIII